MRYFGIEAYRASWDEWQPETEDEITFVLHDLKISAGQDVAFAHSVLHCGGRTVEGTESGGSSPISTSRRLARERIRMHAALVRVSIDPT